MIDVVIIVLILSSIFLSLTVFTVAFTILSRAHLQNLPGKLGQQSSICWNSLGLFRDYGLNYILFRNNFFFVFQDRKLKLSEFIWKSISWNLIKYQLIQAIFIFIFCSRCLIWVEMRVPIHGALLSQFFENVLTLV